MKPKYLLIIFMSVCFSCRNGVNIVLENKSDTVIDSVLIHTGFNKIKLEKIRKNELHKFFVDFRNHKHGKEGVFSVIIFNNGKIKNHQGFGYYSYGIPPSYDFNIRIETDTILIKHIAN
ncbi:hypothetical protein JYU05_00990 [bacterium AH-315-P13]|nr:hypothetical protein [bacterium AH-315-P13]MBN4084807.1 hypothetical protein [Flavobacteriaceae bacterium AH-315-B10]